MTIDYMDEARNTGESTWITVDSRRIFNFDGLTKTHTEKEAEFLSTLTIEWKRIPSELLDETTVQNFRCYARLATEE